MAQPSKEPFAPPVTERVGEYVFASPKMRGRLNQHGKPWTARTILVYNVRQVLYKHNNRHAKRAKTVSERTRSGRFIECRSMAHDLHDLGYRIMLPTQIRQKHVKALTHYWEARPDLKPASAVQKVSTLRTFLNWMGKGEVIETLKPADLFDNPEQFKRSHVAETDKSWESKADPLELIESVRERSRFVADQLMLTHLFGLRAKESWHFRPRQDYIPEEGIVHVRRGTKGGRARTVPVTTHEQKAFLENLVANTYHVEDSMTPRTTTIKAWKHRYYRITREFGITQKDGMTTHGLRHGYAHRIYENIAGQPAAVKASPKDDKKQLDRINDQIARLMVSESLGHNRESISSAYIGEYE